MRHGSDSPAEPVRSNHEVFRHSHNSSQPSSHSSHRINCNNSSGNNHRANHGNPRFSHHNGDSPNSPRRRKANPAEFSKREQRHRVRLASSHRQANSHRQVNSHR